jgi:homoserine O-acetyltransferase/O-succinyltransferase
MKTNLFRLVAGVFTATIVTAFGVLQAAEFPAPSPSVFTLKNFKFQSGETLAELKIHYVTIGDPKNEAVLVLHGTTGSAANMTAQSFGGELFGAGQPLDATRYFIVIPDSIGTGKSSKPSDGLKTQFPKYNYEDTVEAQHRLIAEHLGIKRLRLVIGNSMGGMQTWIWAHKHPKMMDIAAPMASMPSEMSSRNWMMRRLIIDSIRNDPEWMQGNYTKQPKSAQTASVFYALATNGGDQGLYKAAPTRAQADAVLNQRMAAPFPLDANDVLYQWDSSRDYNPSPHLEKISATVFAINSADDERNPTSLGLMERELKRIKNAKLFLIPASENTAGHGTTAQAKFWKKELEQVLRDAPRQN